MSGLLALQQGIYTQLSTNAALTSLLAVYDFPAIFDEVPQASDSANPVRFPYVVIGRDTATAWDTDTEIGTSATVTIDTWSRTADFVQTKTIMQAIYNALHRQEFAIPGYTLIGSDLEFADAVADPDGITRHGIQRFRMIYEE